MYRQKKDGEWRGVIKRAADDLGKMVQDAFDAVAA
jgi:phosphate uptake regulator